MWGEGGTQQNVSNLLDIFFSVAQVVRSLGMFTFSLYLFLFKGRKPGSLGNCCRDTQEILNETVFMLTVSFIVIQWHIQVFEKGKFFGGEEKGWRKRGDNPSLLTL